jgi:hypothetical protein
VHGWWGIYFSHHGVVLFFATAKTKTTYFFSKLFFFGQSFKGKHCWGSIACILVGVKFPISLQQECMQCKTGSDLALRETPSNKKSKLKYIFFV